MDVWMYVFQMDNTRDSLKRVSNMFISKGEATSDATRDTWAAQYAGMEVITVAPWRERHQPIRLSFLISVIPRTLASDEKL